MNKEQALLVTFLFFAVLIPAIGFSQEAEIKQIRERYDLIEGYKTTSSSTTFQAEEDPTSGKITRFWNEGKLVKIEVEWGAEHGGSGETFYYWEGKLFFVLKSDSLWRFTGKKKADGESETLDTVKEYRFYIKDGKCLRSLFKEAKNTNADLLDKQLAGVANEAFNNPTLSEEVEKRGRGWYSLFIEKAILRVFGE